MALASLTEQRARTRERWWLWPLALWAVSRLVSTAFLGALAGRQELSAWTPARPDLLDYSTMWDAHWYYIVAMSGYPTELPLGEDGHVGENAWAFMPVYPMLARVLMLVGLPWEGAAVLLSVAASLAFALVAYRLFAELAPGRERFALALVLLSPLAPVLQLGYAESLFLLLLAGALLAWRLHAWEWLWVLIPIMSLTRPGGLAFALALGLWFLVRWYRDRSGFPVAERRMLVGLGAWSALWGFGWLIACTIATGSLTSYLETELSWRSTYIGRQELVPFTPWPIGLEWWFGAWWPLWLAGILLVAVLLLAGPWATAVGIEGRLWLIAYLVYLAAVWFPQSSTWRLLMPIFPAAAILAAVRPAWARAMLLAACIALQPVWIWFCWHVDGRDWTVP
ncbi:hypothetical protein SAMN04487783_2025 [Agrococcus baldri]|uniref:Mannosyltransferase (PIG-V) n=1 Tax=Agrococcus baldri TaxID=153730 RepID=A0AA94HNK0_9MICO|nr:hypothetical protein [Agrococcus baldri]SFS15399.1 hypothetical protein SAMN04487783_2025 [Agrococcus baldri]